MTCALCPGSDLCENISVFAFKQYTINNFNCFPHKLVLDGFIHAAGDTDTGMYNATLGGNCFFFSFFGGVGDGAQRHTMGLGE